MRVCFDQSVYFHAAANICIAKPALFTVKSYLSLTPSASLFTLAAIDERFQSFNTR